MISSCFRESHCNHEVVIFRISATLRGGGTDRHTRDSKMSITALPLPVAEVLDPFHKLDRALLRRVKDKVKAILLEALKDPGV